MSRAVATTDHEEIRGWTEHRGGHPATVKQTERNGEPGILRIDFDPPDESLEEMPWEEFFDGAGLCMPIVGPLAFLLCAVVCSGTAPETYQGIFISNAAIRHRPAARIERR